MKKLLIIIVFLPTLCFGWGAEGHRIIGAIADQHLTDVTRSKMNKMMKQSLSDVSNWMDEMRDQWGGANTFHYISMPVDALRYEPNAHCANEGICALSMIERHTRRLKDVTESPGSHGESIKIITHLVEDLHMPLHTGGQKDDYGGNAVKVDFFGKRSNLHKIFDTNIIVHANKSEEQWIADLTKDLTPEKIRAIQAGDIYDWIDDSHKDVLSLYENLPKKKGGEIIITEEYVAFGTKIIEEQMLEAGLRLAKYLNDTMAKVVIR